MGMMHIPLAQPVTRHDHAVQQSAKWKREHVHRTVRVTTAMASNVFFLRSWVFVYIFLFLFLVGEMRKYMLCVGVGVSRGDGVTQLLLVLMLLVLVPLWSDVIEFTCESNHPQTTRPVYRFGRGGFMKYSKLSNTQV